MPNVVFALRDQQHSRPLLKDEVTIGRSPDNDIYIDETSISRYHAKIRRDGGAWRVVDLNSKNGTRVNGAAPTGAPLQDGDEILLGTFGLVFQEDADRPVADKPAPRKPEPAGPEIDEGSGTVFQSAMDFNSIANRPVARDRQPEAEIERLKKLLAIVTNVSKELLASRELGETLEKVLDIVFEQLPVERGCILLWDEKTQRLVPRVRRDKGGSGKEELAPPRAIAEKVYREKVAILAADAGTEFQTSASVMMQGIRSAMAAPLWNADRVDGLIYVDTPFLRKAFDDADLGLLSALGNYAAVAIEQARLQDSVDAEKRSRQKLERYHSPAVVERIMKGGAAEGAVGSEGALEAEERDVTVLFADAVGFTDRCERTEPRAVAELLNRYFSEMAEMVFKREGTLDKFIGDCLMAVFGAPLPMPDHAVRAVESVLDMRDALRRLNAEMPEEDRVVFRVGLHSGRVVAGDIGSTRRSDYTVLGATVNLAARLQSSVAEAGQIIISDTTNDALGDRFETRFVGEFQPKGISRAVRCYEVLGRRAGADTTRPSTPRTE